MAGLRSRTSTWTAPHEPQPPVPSPESLIPNPYSLIPVIAPPLHPNTQRRLQPRNAMPPKDKRSKSTTATPAWFGRLIRLMRGPAGPFVWVAILVVALAGGWYAVWRKIGDDVLASEQYEVTPQQVEVTPQPPWIHTDVRFEVLRNASLDGPLSILDDRLAERIARAFSLSPWVADVVHVAKLPGARLKVDLVYRRPVCMVALRDDLLPVDADGVLLPYGNDDFSGVERSRYPRVVGIATAPAGTVGECWGDTRVVGGAEIAAALADVWEPLGLLQIEPSAPLATAEEPTYTLLTHGGTRVFWGRAPGTHTPGELPASEKIARLLEYKQQHGSLEDPRGPRELDVYSLRTSSEAER